MNGVLKIILLIALIHSVNLYGNGDRPVVYLIPGQGSDYRLFKNIHIDSTFETRTISYTIPGETMTMAEYAQELSHQIDTSGPYIFIGVSLGGMIATEMGDFMHPEKIILISSAKCREELPARYRFQRKFPIYKSVSGKTAKKGAKLMQPIVEPDRRKEKQTCIDMLNDKDPVFLKNTIKMILEWDRNDYRKDIIHIHGDKDHTIPVRHVKYDFLVHHGSHMMVLTRSDEISKLLNKILLNE